MDFRDEDVEETAVVRRVEAFSDREIRRACLAGDANSARRNDRNAPAPFPLAGAEKARPHQLALRIQSRDIDV